MRLAITCAAAMLALECVSALAQPAGTAIDRLRACAMLPTTERTKCLDQLSQALEPQPSPSRSMPDTEGSAPPEDWVFSETTSPVDYSPVVVATATTGVPAGSRMKLSITCRGGSTSFALSGPAGLPADDRYVVWYAIDGGSQKAMPAIATAGAGMVVGGDVVGLLLSLPARGEVVFRIVGRSDLVLEGRYSLAGLKTARERMAAPCKWPSRSDSPRR